MNHTSDDIPRLIMGLFSVSYELRCLDTCAAAAAAGNVIEVHRLDALQYFLLSSCKYNPPSQIPSYHRYIDLSAYLASVFRLPSPVSHLHRPNSLSFTHLLTRFLPSRLRIEKKHLDMDMDLGVSVSVCGMWYVARERCVGRWSGDGDEVEMEWRLWFCC